MDPAYPTIDSLQFPVFGWREYYSDSEEPITTNSPDAIGQEVDLGMLLIVIMQEINVCRGLTLFF